MTCTPPSLTIRRLRVPVCGCDRLAARRDWERAFAAADAVPPELAEDGILLLRHVAWRGGQRELPALRRWLSGARQRAVCPAEAAPAANADAVWFHDEAELLFCLSRDWIAGAVGAGWWWAALGLASAESVWRRWHAAPRAVPAAIERCVRGGLVQEFLVALGPEAVRALALAVAAEFALPALREVLEAPADAPDAPATMPRRLRELMPEAPPELRHPALALWLTSLLLVRHPARARSLAVASALREWLRPPVEPPPGDDAPACLPASPEAESPSVTELHEAFPTKQPQFSAERREATTRAAAQVAELSRDQASVTQTAQPPSSPLAPATPLPRDASARFVSRAEQTPPARAVADLVLPVQRTPETEKRVSPLRVRTDFGGIFYLLNVALDLGIYSDFTRPQGPNLVLSPFDWLALLGRHWFAPELEADPLRRLLAEMTGRAHAEPPGFPEGIADPEGWLAHEAERVHQRLVAGLPEAFARDLPGCVCRQGAEVCVSHQRVEVRFALAAHPLELRWSGLDRDPGWLPAAGRGIYFRYD
jgi:hypothetical protein